ncbi:hypothetical protein [Halomarina rubra]|uniref:Uncharacterized protein n=1 Tax=Halomarina rubra TaxID=2071873 RepID=A0ABD6B1C6_9EURY|nr:hypothetical protein [Halomarina rubra]
MQRAAATALGVAAVLLAALAASVVVGVVDVPSPFDDADSRSEQTDAAAGPAASQRNYSLSIDGIEPCGTTCRDVTVTLTNRAAEDRENVTVRTRLFADGDLLWTGRERVGTLPANGSHTLTARVELGVGEALAVERNDGYVTVERTVQSDAGTAVLTRRRQVD